MKKLCNDQRCFQSERIDAQLQPDCAKCGKPCYFDSPVIYRNRYWHSKCFVCSVCGHDLRHGYFNESSVATFECSQCTDKIQKQLNHFKLKRCHLCNRSTRTIGTCCKKNFYQPYHQCHCINACESRVSTPSDRFNKYHLPHNYKWPYFRQTHSSSLEDIPLNSYKSNNRKAIFNSKVKDSLKNKSQADSNESDKQPSKRKIHKHCSSKLY